MTRRVFGGLRVGLAFLCLACVGGGCSALVDGGGGDYPNAPTLTLSPSTIRLGDVATVRAAGSTDPRGAQVRYRFDWLRGTDAELMRTQVADEQDTLNALLTKGEEWTVRVTPVTEDEREGSPAEYAFAVQNTPPTLQTVSLNTYRPVATDRVTAKVVGYEDADGDADASQFVWTVGERDSITTTDGIFDLETVSAIGESETLTVEVIASDGQGDGGSFVLGPFDIMPDATRARFLSPTHLIGAVSLGNFIAWDDRHRRFLFSDSIGGSLWEYSASQGFSELTVRGTTPGFTGLIETAYDGTPGSERLLMLFAFAPGSLSLYALELRDRGLEQWSQIPLPPNTGPQVICGYSTYFDQKTQHLLIYGGTAGFCQPQNTPLNELWVLDLNDPENAAWVSGGPLSFAESRFLATMVEHPTDEDALLLFGGFNNPFSPAGTLRLEYDLSNPDALYAETGSSGLLLSGGPLGAFAIPDPERDVIIGGLGVDQSGDAVESIWVYDPGSSAADPFSFPATEVFQTFDTSLGASRGSGGWDGNRVLLFPGQTVFNVRYFRLLEIVPKQGRYDWHTVTERGLHYPALPKQVTLDGTKLLVTANEAQSTFYFDLTTRAWSPASFDNAPPARTGVLGGNASDGSLWVVGGVDADMQPWRYADGSWESIEVTGPVPGARSEHRVFDPGCGAQTPMAMFGGVLEATGEETDETWLLQCPAEQSACHWEALGGSAPSPRRRALIGHDGRRYAVMYGGREGLPLPFTDAYRADLCGAPELGWEAITLNPDPAHGAPVSTAFRSLTPVPSEGDPLFLVQAGFSHWWLRESPADEYTWERWDPNPSAACPGSPAVWDTAGQRLLQTCPEAEVFELRYRPE